MADSPVTSSVADLLSLTSHELRTPAAVVAGYLRMLRQDKDHPLAGRQQRLVDEAERSIVRLIALIAEMSELAALETRTAAVHRERFDLFAAARTVGDEVRESVDGRVRLDVRGPAEGAPIFGDLARLKAALSAVFRTTLREQVAEGTVVAECGRVEDAGQPSALVVVAPASALGAAAAAPRMRFNELRGGLGLALPIARRVIEDHGGTIWSPAPSRATDEGLRGAILISMPISGTSR